MAKRTPKPGEAWKLVSKPEVGTQTVEVTAVNGDTIAAAFGRLTDDGYFIRRSFQPKSGGPAKRSATFTRDEFAQFIQKIRSDNAMATKKENAEVPANTGELTYEMDDAAQTADAAVPAPAKKPKMTAKEKAAAILKADAEKQKAAKEKEEARKKEAERKEKEKAKKAAEKRAETLKDLAQKAGVKEADAAAQYGGEAVKRFIDLPEDKFEAAKTGLKATAADKKKADKLALATKLNDEESKEKRDLEKIVEKNIGNFQQAAFQIGGALTAISQKRLYRDTHKTFADYVLERFGLSRPHAYSVMAAAETFAALTDGEKVDAKTLPSITAAEAITRGVKGLLKEAGQEANPEVAEITKTFARNAYQLAVQNAPLDKDGNPILSPDHLASTFKVLGEVAKSGVVEVDGKSVPVNLAATAIDEMITAESKERSDRAKQVLADRIQKAKDDAAQARRSHLDEALNSATGNGAAIPEGVTPRLNTVCSVHGRVELSSSTDTDVTLGCGCVFIHTTEGFKFERNTKQATATSA